MPVDSICVTPTTSQTSIKKQPLPSSSDNEAKDNL